MAVEEEKNASISMLLLPMMTGYNQLTKWNQELVNTVVLVAKVFSLKKGV